MLPRIWTRGLRILALTALLPLLAAPGVHGAPPAAAATPPGFALEGGEGSASGLLGRVWEGLLALAGGVVDRWPGETEPIAASTLKVTATPDPQDHASSNTQPDPWGQKPPEPPTGSGP